jgi:hypothetical protein
MEFSKESVPISTAILHGLYLCRAVENMRNFVDESKTNNSELIYTIFHLRIAEAQHEEKLAKMKEAARYFLDLTGDWHIISKELCDQLRAVTLYIIGAVLANPQIKRVHVGDESLSPTLYELTSQLSEQLFTDWLKRTEEALRSERCDFGPPWETAEHMYGVSVEAYKWTTSEVPLSVLGDVKVANAISTEIRVVVTALEVLRQTAKMKSASWGGAVRAARDLLLEPEQGRNAEEEKRLVKEFLQRARKNASLHVWWWNAKNGKLSHSITKLWMFCMEMRGNEAGELLEAMIESERDPERLVLHFARGGLRGSGSLLEQLDPSVLRMAVGRGASAVSLTWPEIKWTWGAS